MQILGLLGKSRLFFIFIQIGFGHTVSNKAPNFPYTDKSRFKKLQVKIES